MFCRTDGKGQNSRNFRVGDGLENFKGVFKAEEALKRLFGAQITPLPHGQSTQADAAHANSLEAHHLQTHLLAHAPNLTFLAFFENKAKLLWVLPFHLGRLQGLAIQTEAMP